MSTISIGLPFFPYELSCYNVFGWILGFVVGLISTLGLTGDLSRVHYYLVA